MAVTSPASAQLSPTPTPDFIDVYATIRLGANTTITPGQTYSRQLVAPSQAGGADPCMTAASGGGPVLGAYQGDPLTNRTTATRSFAVLLRKYGYGIVRCGAAQTDVAIKVGDPIVVRTGVIYAVHALATGVVPGTFVGIAMATGTAVNLGDVIVPVPGSGQTTNVLVNVMLNC